MNDPKINIEGSTIGGFVIGEGGVVRDISIIQGAPIQHPKANEVKQKLIELRKSIEDSHLTKFQKNDALNSLKELTEQLETEETPERQEGILYYLKNLFKFGESVKSISDIAISLAQLLSLSI
jgi:hypothetical protein